MSHNSDIPKPASKKIIRFPGTESPLEAEGLSEAGYVPGDEDHPLGPFDIEYDAVSGTEISSPLTEGDRPLVAEFASRLKQTLDSFPALPSGTSDILERYVVISAFSHVLAEYFIKQADETATDPYPSQIYARNLYGLVAALNGDIHRDLRDRLPANYSPPAPRSKRVEMDAEKKAEIKKMEETIAAISDVFSRLAAEGRIDPARPDFSCLDEGTMEILFEVYANQPRSQISFAIFVESGRHLRGLAAPGVKFILTGEDFVIIGQAMLELFKAELARRRGLATGWKSDKVWYNCFYNEIVAIPAPGKEAALKALLAGADVKKRQP